MRFLVNGFRLFRGRVRNLVRLVKSGFPVSGAMPLALPGSVRVRNLVRLNVRRLTPESSVSGTALIPGFVRVRFLAFFVFRGRVRNLVRLLKSGSPVSGAMPLALPGSVRVRNLVRLNVTSGSSPLPLALPGSMHSDGVVVERERLLDFFLPVFLLCGVLAHVGTISFVAESFGVHFSPSSHFS